MAKSTDVQTDREAITAVVRDYFESWYEGDPERMGRALHPRLAKRAPMGGLLESGHVHDVDPDALDEDTRQTMVDASARGVGTTRARTPDKRAIEVRIDDLYHWIATVTVTSAIYHEYLHLVRTSEGWKIVNALWQRTVREGGDRSG